MKYVSTLILFIALAATSAWGQTIYYGTADSTYTQNFDGLPNSGIFTVPGAVGTPVALSSSPINATGMPGWYFDKNDGSGTTQLFKVDIGSSTSGGCYSYGVAGTNPITDRALGSLGSGTYAARFGALITNHTGGTLNKLTITYTGEEWRYGGTAAQQSITFSYKVNAASISDASGFTAVTALNFLAPVYSGTAGALDGNATANRTTGITATISGLTWADGQTLAIRWLDINDPGSDEALAVDDLTFSAGVQPPTNYYYKGSGDLNNVANWGTNTNGTGTAPPDFATIVQIFNIRNTSSVSTTSAWTVSGAGSKIVVGDGTNPCMLTVASGLPITASMDVSANATLVLDDATLPTLGSLDVNSTVDYAQSGTVAVSNGSYGNLKLTGGTKTIPSGSTTVSGNMVVDGVTGFTGSGTLLLGGNLTLQDGTTMTTGMTINCNGSTAQTFTGNGTDISFFRFTQGNSHGVILSTTGGSSNLLITGTSGGNLVIGANTITTNSNYVEVSGSSGILTNVGNGYIIGNFKKDVAAATGLTTFEVGTAANYHPLTINYSVAPTTPGSITVGNTVPDLIGHDLPVALNDAGYSVTKRSDQYWTVTQTTIAGGTYDLSVNFAGQNGIGDTANVRIIHSTDGSSFDLVGTHSAASNNVANRTGIDGSVAGRFYLGGKLPDVPLPVTVKGITAKVDAGKIYLNISTATEIDVAGFNISRSLSKDGPFDLISSYASNSALKASGSVTSGGSYSFVDSKVSAGQTYYYKVESVSKSGASQQVGEILKVQVLLPKAYAVYQNYPNPFNPTTSIRFDLKADAKVMVEVYNLLGMKVRSLNNGTMSAGTHEVPVDMSKMASGVYYYRFTAVDNTGNAFVQTQRMVLVK